MSTKNDMNKKGEDKWSLSVLVVPALFYGNPCTVLLLELSILTWTWNLIFLHLNRKEDF